MPIVLSTGIDKTLRELRADGALGPAFIKASTAAHRDDVSLASHG
jgi:hypothetical protein